ncbi:hypothetical protein FSP39_012167 [Pinctada imbricata]|uniref:Uncharacterized protein n=1 Tax=Pinctada imbricata TaxID=66713 RepID=A0AA89CAL1_PINIB|nr:hypothetical protein FSP39_012167 [Pinctada imbricata]
MPNVLIQIEHCFISIFTGRLYCNATFDTVRCWGVTLAGTRTYGDCPKSLPQSELFSPDGFSFKDCTKNGTWWTHPATGRPWTNYTTCIQQAKLEIWCRVLHVATQYATICNYAWMFCEGLYLHSIIAFAFTNQKRLLIICCVIGWVVPLLPTAIYAIVHATVSTDEKLSSCWKNTSNTMWIPMTPIILSLVLNFIFLINILRILLSKLRAVNSNETHQYRRTARACLILIPLLGVQYIMMPFQPSGDAFAYKIITAILISYQVTYNIIVKPCL